MSAIAEPLERAGTAAPGDVPLLAVRGLRAQYGPTRVLHGIDFEVQQGGITTVLGANGAGKTTTLRAMCGMVKTEGRITLAGTRIDGLATENVVRRGVAHVPDGRGTFLNLSVEENLRLGAYTRRDREAVEPDAERVYGYFPRLKERRKQQAGTLSGGEQQMLAVSRALMLKPKLMLLDEPSFGLAPIIVADIFRIVGELRAAGVSVLLVEQNAQAALQIADRAYVMELGEFILSGPANDIASNQRVAASYLGFQHEGESAI